MNKQHARRQSQRVPISSRVTCELADLTKFGGKAYNLSTSGIAMKTNYPIAIREKFRAELLIPEEVKSLIVEGRVVWRRFHGDSLGPEDTLFTAGIRFVNLEEPSRVAIREYIKSSKAEL